MNLDLIRWEGVEAPLERALHERLIDEGFEVSSWRDEPGATYAAHSHDRDETLWLMEGRIVFEIGDRRYDLGPGDRLMLPRGTVHAAKAGPAGAAYLIGQMR